MPKIIGTVAVILALLYSGYYYRDRTVQKEIDDAVAAKELEMVAIQNKTVADCAAKFNKAMEESNEYQTQLANRDGELARLKRLHKQTIVSITQRSAGLPASGATSTDSARVGTQHCGIPAETLLDSASRCERFRLRAQLCKVYLERVFSRKPSDD